MIMVMTILVFLNLVPGDSLERDIDRDVSMTLIEL
jgi:hypothetical protein